MVRAVPQYILLVFAIGLFVPGAMALETDQYTVPPKPLVDIAPQVQQRVRAILQEVVSETNSQYLDHAHDAAHALLPWSRNQHAEAARQLQSEEAVAERVADRTAPGLFESKLEAWVAHSKFPVEPYIFAPTIGESVYGGNPLAKPVTLLEVTPTVNFFGVYLGTDKVGHFFQQGYEYYQFFRQAEAAGADANACLAKAIGLGITQETNYFGLLTVGVYSNADMAANYAGLKFYLNLTRPVMVGGRRLPPILVKRLGLWEINRDLPADFFRPFISEHLNEAMNPSLYSPLLQNTVRTNFAPRAAAWAAFYHADHQSEQARLHRLTTFFGEYYGHSEMDGVIAAADLIPERKIIAHQSVGNTNKISSVVHE